MLFPIDYVNSIRVQLHSSDLGTETTCSKLLKECTSAWRNLNKRLKSAKSVSDKAHITACLAQIKGFQHHLKDKKVGGGTGVRRLETATHRVKWNDVDSAFTSRIRTGVITNVRHKEVLLFLDDCATLFIRKIRVMLKNNDALKVNTVLCGEFQISKADEILEEVKYLNTANAAIHGNTDLKQWFTEKVIQPLQTDLGEFQERFSGWALSRVLHLSININKYNPLRAGTYIKLPRQIAIKKACVNVQNVDNICFAWAVVSALYPTISNINKPSSYPDPKTVLNLKGIRFPIALRQIPQFEAENSISINVYRLQKDRRNFQLCISYLTKTKQDKHVNLLLLQDSYPDNDEMTNLITPKYHFVWIKNLSRIVSKQLSKRNGEKYICDRCLHYFRSSKKLCEHTQNCIKINDYVVPKLPSKDYATVEFKNYSFKITTPFVIYADTECLLVSNTDETVKKTQIT